MYILRFYGSCGHITNENITKEIFDEYSKEITVKTIFGDQLHKNETSTESDDEHVVHVHPFRFFACLDCMNEDLKIYEK